MKFTLKASTLAASTLLLFGCATTTTSPITATYLKNSPRHTIEGLDGFMPMSKIRYAGYTGEVKKGWQSGFSADVFSGFAISEEKSQPVTITQSNPNGDAVALHYLNRCSASGFRLQELGWDSVDVDKEVNGELVYNGTTWQLQKNGLRNVLGHQYELSSNTVKFKDKVILEFYLNAYEGGFNTKSYVWINNKAGEEQRLLSAALLNFAVSFEPLECGEV